MELGRLSILEGVDKLDFLPTFAPWHWFELQNGKNFFKGFTCMVVTFGTFYNGQVGLLSLSIVYFELDRLVRLTILWLGISLHTHVSP